MDQARQSPFITNYTYCYLKLDVPPMTLFTCGDVIRATVHLRPRPSGPPVSIASLRVDFKGKIVTHALDRSEHNNEIELFSMSSTIHSGGYLVTDAQQSWRVEFSFPWTVRIPPERRYLQNILFERQPDPRLPPSCYTTVGFKRQSIHYHLEAVSRCQFGDKHRDDRMTLPLQFSPPPETLNASLDPKTGARRVITRQAHELDPSYAECTKWQRLKLSASIVKAPKAQYYVRASAPSVCSAGGILPIALNIEYDADNSTASEKPDIALEFVQAQIRPTTHSRVVWKSFRLPAPEQTEESHDTIEISKQSFSPPRMLQEGWNRDIVQCGPVPESCAPTFTTFTIRRTYVLIISFKFLCGGHKYQHTLVRHGLTILPAPRLLRAMPVLVLEPGQIPHPGSLDPAHIEELGPPDDDHLPGEEMPYLPTYEEATS